MTDREKKQPTFNNNLSLMYGIFWMWWSNPPVLSTSPKIQSLHNIHKNLIEGVFTPSIVVSRTEWGK